MVIPSCERKHINQMSAGLSVSLFDAGASRTCQIIHAWNIHDKPFPIGEAANPGPEVIH